MLMGVLRELLALEDTPDAGQEVLSDDRFANEIHGAHFESAAAKILVGQGGDEHRRGLDSLLNHDLEQFEAIERRNVDVEQDQGELSPSQLQQGIGAILGEHDLVSRGPQDLVKKRTRDQLVLDNQNEDRPGRPFESLGSRGSERAVVRENQLIQTVGLAVGLDVEIAPQRFSAQLILAQRRLSPSLLHIETHEHAMNDLLAGVESEEPMSGTNGPVRESRFDLLGADLSESSHRGIEQSVPLALQPFFDWFISDDESFQKLASIESGGLSQGVDSAGSNQPVECNDVSIDPRFDERYMLALGLENLRREELPKGQESLPEAVTGMLFARFRPQEGGQFVPGVNASRVDGKISEKGLAFLCWDELLFAMNRDLEPTKQAQLNDRLHGAPDSTIR